MTLLPNGCWNCGLWRPRRNGQCGCAQPPLQAYSSGIGSADLTPPRSLPFCGSRAIRVAAGVTEAAVLHIRSLITRLRLANQELRAAEKKLDKLLQAQIEDASCEQDHKPSDATILTSLPGIGRITLAILLAEASDPLSRRDYAALRTLSGVAPVTKRSGKSHVVSMRYAAHPRLRNAVFYWLRAAIQNDREIRCRYEALRKRGHSYGRALRGVADRLLELACVLLRRRELFDPTRRTSTGT